ncbi:hypothetical protein KBV71_13950 [Xanthomonas translucens pv. translucens]|nr:hypothetical protein KBQ49_10940 [Xanthomonas translucens pv. translucens]UNU10347.1 hypothetical protein KBV71_13950 [Xanthomonas translucens pv. translucens]
MRNVIGAIRHFRNISATTMPGLSLTYLVGPEESPSADDRRNDCGGFRHRREHTGSEPSTQKRAPTHPPAQVVAGSRADGVQRIALRALEPAAVQPVLLLFFAVTAIPTFTANSYGLRALPLPMHSTSGACTAYRLCLRRWRQSR